MAQTTKVKPTSLRATPASLLLLLLSLHSAAEMSGWGGCLEGRDVFARVRENSRPGEVVAELAADTSAPGLRWRLGGRDADWFFLDDRYVRLNTSPEKALDREAQGPILVAELLCYEEGLLQSVYRVMVEIRNENDNSPVFAENTEQSLFISELTPVDTVVFVVMATDADKDMIIYSIDQTSPDADYFKIELPNSGEVVLSKPLDYETKNVLAVTIHASEMSTAEHFNTSTNITVNVVDGDDQYPHFLPCAPLQPDRTSHVCSSPVYTANVTEGEADMVLDFSPGPIFAVDGDRGLRTSLSYAIISGDDDGRFQMDSDSGEMRLTRGVTDRLSTRTLQLQIMAYQDDDPRKYSLAAVSVRILAVNRFLPEFDQEEYHGFVNAAKMAASLVSTYGGEVLMLHVHDQDFEQGFNPMMDFSFSPSSNHTDDYQITQDGLLIARSSQLKAKETHTLQVEARDRESGDVTFTTVLIQVLAEGQTIPLSPLGDQRQMSCTVGKALVLSAVFLSLLGCVLSLIMWLKRKRRGKRDPLERGCVAQGKHPNVSLRWFHLVSHGTAMPHSEETAEDYGTYNPSFSLADKPVMYTIQDLPHVRAPAPPVPPVPPVPPATTAAPDSSLAPTDGPCSPVPSDKNADSPSRDSSCSFHSADTKPTQKTSVSSAGSSLPTPTESPAQPDSVSCPTSPLTQSDPPRPASDDLTESVFSPSPEAGAPTRIALAEIDKPFRKTRVRTPPYSPLLSHPKQLATPPHTPEQAPLKATLIHIDTSPLDTPPETPMQKSQPLSAAEEPCTSLDQIEPPTEQVGRDAEGLVQDQRAPENSGDTQVALRGAAQNEGGLLGDEVRSDDELAPEDEELLRVMARCNPIFITFK